MVLAISSGLAKARVAGSNPVSRSNIQSSSQDARLRSFILKTTAGSRVGVLSFPLHHDGCLYSGSRSECFSPQVMQITDMVEVTGVTFVSVDTSVRILQSMAYFIPVPTSFQLDALSGA